MSFCIATTNINPDYWGRRAFGADAYPAPNCLEPDSTSGGLDHFKQGMSVGWTDEYNWFLPGQYVEVTGVPDGDYILDTTVDPTDRLDRERPDEQLRRNPRPVVADGNREPAGRTARARTGLWSPLNQNHVREMKPLGGSILWSDHVEQQRRRRAGVLDDVASGRGDEGSLTSAGAACGCRWR